MAFKYTIGDIVVGNIGQFKEMTGKVIESDVRGCMVRFTGWTNGHNGNTGSNEKDCWYLYDNQLELKQSSFDIGL